MQEQNKIKSVIKVLLPCQTKTKGIMKASFVYCIAMI